MPVKSGTVKIFLGNLSDQATPEDIRPMFETYGKVVEADVIKNYGFVHMEEEVDAKKAIAELSGRELHGKPMVVELSTGLNKRGGRRGKCKVFVGNVHKDTTLDELKGLFSEHGTVVEADIISNYAFVHMDGEEAAQAAIEQLNGRSVHGQELRVQMSTSTVRQTAGMDRSDVCFRCGSRGHWSKDCGRQGASPGAQYAPAPHYAAPPAADPYGYSGAYAVARDRGRYAPYPPAYAAPVAPAYTRREVYYEPAPRRQTYYETQPAYYDPPYDDFDLYDRRRPAPPLYDPYGPPPAAARRYDDALYDRRPTALPAYRVPQPRRLY